jgi:hypothetical protein|tara:strand:+ start:151 stop:573 length:423 start_codon:yes stop_codon:yes gene_type:complete
MSKQYSDISDGFINNADNVNEYSQGPEDDIRFTEADKVKLLELFKTSLKSPKIGTVKSFGKERNVYEFPPGTVIDLVKNNGEGYIDITVPGHSPNKRIDLNNSDKAATFKKMLDNTLLSKDISDKDFVPIDFLYELYLKR